MSESSFGTRLGSLLTPRLFARYGVSAIYRRHMGEPDTACTIIVDNSPAAIVEIMDQIGHQDVLAAKVTARKTDVPEPIHGRDDFILESGEVWTICAPQKDNNDGTWSVPCKRMLREDMRKIARD